MIQTDIDFPSVLPCPQREGKAVRTVQPFSRTTMTTGRAIQRRRFSSVPSMVQVSWVFNSEQAVVFEAWFRDAIKDGASWFNIDIRFPLGVFPSEFGPCVARFTDMYTGPDQISANHWRYSAELEIWERPLFETGWGILPDFITGMDIFDIAMNREWPEA